MNAIAMLPALVCGAAAAFLTLALLQDVRAQAPAARGIEACADDDGTLRLTEPTVPCKPGQRRMRLSEPKIEKEQTCEQDQARAEGLERRVKDLEYRDRRGFLRGTKVIAPFEVVTKAGKRILYIEEANVTFSNLAGKPVVWILADDSGGNLLTQSADGSVSASIGALEKRAGVVLQEQDRDRIDLGRRSNGRYGLQVISPEGHVIAYVGQSAAGSGLAMVADTAGTPKASMFLPTIGSGGIAGQVMVSNAQGKDVAFLATGQGGAGLLQLTDSSGNLMVEAGVTKEGRGVVRTGPGMWNSGVGIVGLAPSFIIGKAN
jgi:hypothetical protein